MSFHFCTHAWEVRDIDDGTLIVMTERDLDESTLPLLVDDLFQIVQESGTPNLYLDFSKVKLIGSVVIGKLVAVNEKLRGHGGKLIVQGLDSVQYEMFKVTGLTERLDIRRPG